MIKKYTYWNLFYQSDTEYYIKKKKHYSYVYKVNKHVFICINQFIIIIIIIYNNISDNNDSNNYY